MLGYKQGVEEENNEPEPANASAAHLVGRVSPLLGSQLTHHVSTDVLSDPPRLGACVSPDYHAHHFASLLDFAFLLDCDLCPAPITKAQNNRHSIYVY